MPWRNDATTQHFSEQIDGLILENQRIGADVQHIQSFQSEMEQIQNEMQLIREDLR